jgi:LPS-assembly protein
MREVIQTFLEVCASVIGRLTFPLGSCARAYAFVCVLCAVAFSFNLPAQAQVGLWADDSFPAPVLPEVDKEAQVLLEADSLTYNNRTETVTATGKAAVYYGTYTVQADRIVYNKANDTVIAFGDITITEESGTIIKADEIELSNKLREGFIYSVTAILSNNARISAERGIRTEGTVTEFDRAIYTTCKACEEDPTKPLTWQLKADKVRHDKDEQIIEYQSVTLELFGVPVLYLPYFSHPDQ